MLVFGASQKPRKITFPVMSRTNTAPKPRMLIKSAKPVAKVSNSNAATVRRSDTGEVTAMGCSIFRRRRGSSRAVLRARRPIQGGEGGHPGPQPAPVRAFHEQPVGQIFQCRNVLGQRTGGRGVGVHDDD